MLHIFPPQGNLKPILIQFYVVVVLILEGFLSYCINVFYGQRLKPVYNW